MKVIGNGVVELNAYETMAYWWVKRIKNMALEIKGEDDVYDLRRVRFAEIFDYEKLKNSGYRNIYLQLSKKIAERCEGHRRFSQRTFAMNKGHEELVSWLTEITGEVVPNINIGEYGSKDITIVVTQEKGQEPVTLVGDGGRSNYGMSRVPTKYKANSVLCEPRPKILKNSEAQEKGEE